MSHIRALFDVRLFSIHLKTFRMQIFVPCDAMLDYHGSTANIPKELDWGALAHHYL